MKQLEIRPEVNVKVKAAKMACTTLLSQEESTHKIWDSYMYLK